MSTNPSADNISTITELENAISQRARRIVVASNFQAWPDTTEKFYRFLPPEPKGIHACERVWHPGSSRLAGFNDLCDLILGGCEVIIELVPECQQAIRFTEMLLATLNEDVEAQRVASPIGYALVKTTDWSVKDGSGPKILPAPSVIGFTDSENLKAYQVNKPAVIWTKHWLRLTNTGSCIWVHTPRWKICASAPSATCKMRTNSPWNGFSTNCCRCAIA